MAYAWPARAAPSAATGGTAAILPRGTAATTPAVAVAAATPAARPRKPRLLTPSGANPEPDADPAASSPASGAVLVCGLCCSWVVSVAMFVSSSVSCLSLTGRCSRQHGCRASAEGGAASVRQHMVSPGRDTTLHALAGVILDELLMHDLALVVQNV